MSILLAPVSRITRRRARVGIALTSCFISSGNSPATSTPPSFPFHTHRTNTAPPTRPPHRKKKKKRSREESPDDDAVAAASTHNHKDDGEDEEEVPLSLEKDDGLTETQRRHIARQKEREKKNIKNMVSKSHRERIDEFNQYLSVLTEHNDIPRVSAAGNG